MNIAITATGSIVRMAYVLPAEKMQVGKGCVQSVKKNCRNGNKKEKNEGCAYSVENRHAPTAPSVLHVH